MPDDWDDHDGWEKYYRSLQSDEYWCKVATTSPGSFFYDRLGSLIDEFRKRNWMTLWLPGCGFSPLPRVFSSFGFTVYATDVSPSSITYQNNNQSIVEPLLSRITVENQGAAKGRLNAQIHDFRRVFGRDIVDAIFNIKSIQGLSSTSMQLAIRSHFIALRPGGLALFDTMNVQRDSRDQIESALVDAGFYVPLYHLNQWYRKALADTGIPHVFVFNSPMIPQTDDYSHKHGSPEYKRDFDILAEITAEYRSRIDAEYEREQQCVNEETKHAQIIYSTG